MSAGAPSQIAGAVGTAFSAAAQVASTLSSIASMKASFERRQQEWGFQLQMANDDLQISNQQIKISKDQLAVVTQENQIAELQQEHAVATLDFIRSKFTNADLYAFMSRTLENIYSYFLQQSTAMAKLAALQLSFEKQADTTTLIKDDYWLTPSTTFGETGPDRKGMTGSTRLLEDITKLDLFAFELEKTRREYNLTKDISLASNYPFEFQQLKKTGQMNFETNQNMFDYDFPGHYCRLIKRVKVSVLALIPPMQGIKATLLNTGNSSVILNKNYLFRRSRYSKIT